MRGTKRMAGGEGASDSPSLPVAQDARPLFSDGDKGDATKVDVTREPIEPMSDGGQTSVN